MTKKQLEEFNKENLYIIRCLNRSIHDMGIELDYANRRADKSESGQIIITLQNTINSLKRELVDMDKILLEKTGKRYFEYQYPDDIDD